MFTEDYLMRIINQVLVVLMKAIGLRKAGKYSEARQMIDQAIHQLTGLPDSLIDQLEDTSILSMLTVNGQLEIERLVVLGDLYQEEGAVMFEQGQPAQSAFAYKRALRFFLEGFLADDSPLSPESIAKIEALVQKQNSDFLPIDTQLALSDYYRRLLNQDDQTLAAGGLSRNQLDQALTRLQDQIDSFMNKKGE